MPKLTALFLLLLTISAESHAVFIETSVGNYDVGYVPNLGFEELAPTLTSQAWWGSQALAAEFATAVAFDLGMPYNIVAQGPFFAYDVVDDYVLGYVWDYSDATLLYGPEGYLRRSADPSPYWGYAVAEAAVPIPQALWLFVSGIAGLYAMNRRRRLPVNR